MQILFVMGSSHFCFKGGRDSFREKQEGGGGRDSFREKQSFLHKGVNHLIEKQLRTKKRNTMK